MVLVGIGSLAAGVASVLLSAGFRPTRVDRTRDSYVPFIRPARPSNSIPGNQVAGVAMPILGSFARRCEESTPAHGIDEVAQCCGAWWPSVVRPHALLGGEGEQEIVAGEHWWGVRGLLLARDHRYPRALWRDPDEDRALPCGPLEESGLVHPRIAPLPDPDAAFEQRRYVGLAGRQHPGASERQPTEVLADPANIELPVAGGTSCCVGAGAGPRGEIDRVFSVRLVVYYSRASNRRG